MSETKHTPGPWRVNEKTSLVEQDDPLGLFVADCRMLDEGRANAHLIAAAPDMLDALKTILGDPDIMCTHNGNHFCSFDVVRAAIAKAEMLIAD